MDVTSSGSHLGHNSAGRKGRYRPYVGWAAAAGIFLVAVVAIAGNGSSPLRGLLVFAGFGSPFLVAAASLIAPLHVDRQRWVWLVCALGGIVPAYFFIWNGAGFFLLAIVLTFLWAFWGTRGSSG